MAGPGTAETARERVFARFHRELGSGVEGRGPGLAIVREPVNAHAGTIAPDASPTLDSLRVGLRLPLP